MKILEQAVVVARRRRLADNTIDAYLGWIRDFLAFAARSHGRWIHPTKLHTDDVEAYLNDLVITRKLSASSQNQALNYTHVMNRPQASVRSPLDLLAVAQ